MTLVTFAAAPDYRFPTGQSLRFRPRGWTRSWTSSPSTSERRTARGLGASPYRGLLLTAAMKRWGLVEFSIVPHVENPDLPTNTMAAAERWAAGLSGPAFAIDDETAIKVVDGTAEVVSEGHWKLFTRSAVATESGY